MRHESYLFDTHVLLWHLAGDSRLPKHIAELIENPSTRKYISIASAWEVAIKISVGKLTYKGGAQSFWDDVISGGFHEMPLTIAAVSVLETLEYHHRDPFDRIIIASAIADGHIIVTGDEAFSKYPVDIFWSS
jgi:PIN domain nuclease of toxin-antitoxin system